jgi:hypothetical protein
MPGQTPQPRTARPAAADAEKSGSKKLMQIKALDEHDGSVTKASCGRTRTGSIVEFLPRVNRVDTDA